jgi:hypothetical protein
MIRVRLRLARARARAQRTPGRRYYSRDFRVIMEHSIYTRNFNSAKDPT